MRQVILRAGEDGGWVAEVPSLPGCVTQGRTRAEALANVREAIAAWIEDATAAAEVVPPDPMTALVGGDRVK